MAVGSEGVPVDASVWPRPAAFPSGADLLVPPRDRDLTLAWRVLGAAVVVGVLRRSCSGSCTRACCCGHHAERRRPRRPRLVPGVPARPPAPELARRGLVERLVRRLPGRPVLLPGPGDRDRRPRHGPAVQRRAQADDGDRSGADAGGRVRVRPRASACAGRAPSSARSPPSASCSSRASRPARTRRPRRPRSSSTSGSWAGRSSARWRGSTRSRSR